MSAYDAMRFLHILAVVFLCAAGGRTGVAQPFPVYTTSSSFLDVASAPAKLHRRSYTGVPGGRRTMRVTSPLTWALALWAGAGMGAATAATVRVQVLDGSRLPWRKQGTKMLR
jgi:hypothetical protein